MPTPTIDTTYDTLGERLQRARKRTGMTQQELANVLGLSRVTVSNYETDKGEETPPFATIVAWSDATKHPLEYFASAVARAVNIGYPFTDYLPFRDAAGNRCDLAADDVVIDLREGAPALVYRFPMQELPFSRAVAVGLPDAA